MCFPAISTGKPADILKRALIHRALIVFKMLIKDILLISSGMFAAKGGNKGEELFVKNVGAGSGLWGLRTSDLRTNYDLDHQLRARLSLTSASVTPQGKIHPRQGSKRV